MQLAKYETRLTFGKKFKNTLQIRVSDIL